MLALCAVIAGATAAVVTAAQPGSTARNGARSQARRGHRRGTLAAAAAYLGSSPAQVRGELRAGKSLAQIANATPGRSAAGLIAALETAQRARWAARASSLSARITAEVNRAGQRHSFMQTAAHYLGVSGSQLRGGLRSGHTLAQLASSSAGHSEAGLVEALVAARKSALANEVKLGAITQAQADAIVPKLASRVGALVNRARYAHGATSTS